MADVNLEQFHEVTKIFKENFGSERIQDKNEEYVDGLFENLNHWQSRTTELVREITEEKIEEINQNLDEYCDEIDAKYDKFREESEGAGSLSYINDQVKSFKIYCQSNKLEKRVRSNIIQFTKKELAEKIQIKYVPYDDIDEPETNIIPLKADIKSRRESSSTAYSRIATSTSNMVGGINPLSDSSIQEIDNNRSVSKPPHNHSEGQSFGFNLNPTTKTSTPLKTVTNVKNGSNTSSRSTATPSSGRTPDGRKPIQNITNQDVNNNGLLSQPSTDSLQRVPFSTSRTPTTTTNGNVTKNSTRLSNGNHDIIRPVVVETNREIDKTIEFSIDSISIPQGKQRQQPSNINTDNTDSETLLKNYKVLLKQDNNRQQHPTSTSIRDKDEEINLDNDVFNLRKLNQLNYSTILFGDCETEFNCISSSTQRNELVVYNSKLKVLIILQHENHLPCRNRFYLRWPDSLSPNISDITYCQNNDQFLISTDTSHIYFFDRDLLFLTDLGSLSDASLRLRRIHCYQQTVYCILHNNYLLEFELDEHYSRLKFIQRIMLFTPTNNSQDTAYHLLDVTCDNNFLIVVYADDDDEIHLQSIHRQTREFHSDLVLDKKAPINESYIRIESTIYDGNFIYLNGSKSHLKSIDFANHNNGKITSIASRRNQPTNVCFLKDGRLVILYEEPYFLSVHNSNNPQEAN